VVTKIPRFAFEKFPTADSRLTTQMKSVGEVMAMGRTFQESFQKALRGLEVGVDGMNEKTQDREILERELGEPGPERIWYVGDAFAAGWSVDEVFNFTKIDKWFLVQIEEIVKIELALEKTSLEAIDADTLRGLKKKGFSDRRLAKLLKTTDAAVRARRIALMRPPGRRAPGSPDAPLPAGWSCPVRPRGSRGSWRRGSGHRARNRGTAGPERVGVVAVGYAVPDRVPRDGSVTFSVRLSYASD
jgi:hypothetical protein